jgi:hypothetical protein
LRYLHITRNVLTASRRGVTTSDENIIHDLLKVVPHGILIYC